MPMKVGVEPHNPRWAGLYLAESRRLVQVLGSSIIAIHHVGSTAIPGILAKPIIDILVEATDLGKVDERKTGMESLGYEALGEFGIPGRRYFRKDDDGGLRTHHVHIFLAGTPEVMRHLAFRDFLIGHPEWARRYSDLKKSLVAAHPEDMEAYINGKEALIHEIDTLAIAWRTDPSPE